MRMHTEMMEPAHSSIVHRLLAVWNFLIWDALAWGTLLLYWVHRRLIKPWVPMAAWQRLQQAKIARLATGRCPGSFYISLCLPIHMVFPLILWTSLRRQSGARYLATRRLRVLKSSRNWAKNTCEPAAQSSIRRPIVSSSSLHTRMLFRSRSCIICVVLPVICLAGITRWAG